MADNADAIFTWDYEKGARPALNKLYEKAKNVAVERRDRSRLVDRGRPEKVAADAAAWAPSPTGPFAGLDRRRARPLEKWGDEGVDPAADVEQQNWTLSQFMHGEQGALLCTAKIVETVPWIDAKYYASTQVMDEARHVEVFAKYLDTKLIGPLPDQRPPAACCSTTSSTTAAGT